MRVYSLVVALMLISTLYSCDNEDFKPACFQVSDRLSALIADEEITLTRIIFLEGNGSASRAERPIIQDCILELGDRFYNLDHLESFDLLPDGTLFLYFY
ncbi:MAG: hypothetical protein AAF798_02645 [Bacteroidota bacterium]